MGSGIIMEQQNSRHQKAMKCILFCKSKFCYGCVVSGCIYSSSITNRFVYCLDQIFWGHCWSALKVVHRGHFPYHPWKLSPTYALFYHSVRWAVYFIYLWISIAETFVAVNNRITEWIGLDLTDSDWIGLNKRGHRLIRCLKILINWHIVLHWFYYYWYYHWFLSVSGIIWYTIHVGNQCAFAFLF